MTASGEAMEAGGSEDPALREIEGCFMPLDTDLVAECRGWLDLVVADLDSVSILLNADRPRPDTAVFYGQLSK